MKNMFDKRIFRRFSFVLAMYIFDKLPTLVIIKSCWRSSFSLLAFHICLSICQARHRIQSYNVPKCQTSFSRFFFSCLLFIVAKTLNWRVFAIFNFNNYSLLQMVIVGSYDFYFYFFLKLYSLYLLDYICHCFNFMCTTPQSTAMRLFLATADQINFSFATLYSSVCVSLSNLFHLFLSSLLTQSAGLCVYVNVFVA